MHEILEALPPGSAVLDLGCGKGSFDLPDLFAVRLDLAAFPADGSHRVQADAACLPFVDHCFRAVIANHSLEHIEKLDQALSEIGRVLKRKGALYLSVPDAGSCSDRFYRWAGAGGGHINAFRKADSLAGKISRITGLELRAVRDLYSSYSFLNGANPANCPPRRIRWTGLSSEAVLRWISLATRLLDHRLGTRTSFYGWAFYFGNVPGEVDPEAWPNVCVRCGSGASKAWLLKNARLKKGWLVSIYHCPHCQAHNFMTDLPR